MVTSSGATFNAWRLRFFPSSLARTGQTRLFFRVKLPRLSFACCCLLQAQRTDTAECPRLPSQVLETEAAMLSRTEQERLEVLKKEM
jgi:hypothetical protein